MVVLGVVGVPGWRTGGSLVRLFSASL